MILYSSPTSPYVRKVLIILKETGQWDDLDMKPVGGTPIDPGSIPVNLNPLGKIPALQLDNDMVLYDSRVICRYFDDRAKAGLYGEGDTLWQRLTMEATADGILDAAILMVYESRVRPEDKRFGDWVEGQWSKISRALDEIENNWIDILSWDFKSIGEISTVCALGYLDLRHDDRNWRASRPKLADWYAKASERPSVKDTVPVV